MAALSGALSQEHRLLRPESLRRLGEQQFSRYRFRHYLFQRYLYQRLDPVRRAHLHGEVAGALEALGAVPPLPEIEYRMDRWSDDRSRRSGRSRMDRLGSDDGLALGGGWASRQGGRLSRVGRAQGGIPLLSFPGYDRPLCQGAGAACARVPETPPSPLGHTAYHGLAWAQAMTLGWSASAQGADLAQGRSTWPSKPGTGCWSPTR